MVHCCGFIGALKLSHTHTCIQAHTYSNHKVFWQGMWVQRAAWCFCFSLSLNPDQIHQPATKDDVTIPQLSLPLSYPYHSALHYSACRCVCACVCVYVCAKSSTEVKFDSHCLPPFNSAFLQNSRDPTGRTDSCGRHQVPLCVCEAVTHLHTHMHAQAVYSNSSYREWHDEKVGKGGEMEGKNGCFYSRTITNHQRITVTHKWLHDYIKLVHMETERNLIWTVSYLSAVLKLMSFSHSVLSNLILFYYVYVLPCVFFPLEKSDLVIN